MKCKSVLISVPIPPNGFVFGGLSRWITRMTHHPQFDVGYDPVEGKPIDSVRNDATNRFLASRYDYMWAIDSDVVPPDDAIDILFESMDKLQCDAMGGVVYSFQYDEPFAVVMDKHENGGYIQSPLIGMQRYLPCKAVGGACVILTRKLVEAVGPKWFTQYNEKGTISWGQDFFWFEQAICQNNHGFKLYVDSAVVCSHFVTLDLKRVAELILEAEERGRKQALSLLEGAAKE